MTLEVLACDNHLLVVVKPAGVATVPDESGDESLLDQAREWVRREFAKPGNVFLGVVHRLDRPVSGLVCFARTSKGAARLAAAFRTRAVEKTYLGIGAGAPREDAGTLEQLLLKDEVKRRVTVLPPGARRPGARAASTRWRVLARAGGHTLLELVPETGRPHQLRVAAATLGCPLLGDLKYGAAEALPDRSVALHAAALVLPHPTRAETLRFTCPVPRAPWWALAQRLDPGHSGRT